MIDKLN